MSIFGLFEIGKSAILTSQTALNVTSNNIANVNTPGYNRKEVILSIATPVAIRGGFIGRGVVVSDIRRIYNRFIQSQLLTQNQNHGRSAVMMEILEQIEQIFNEAGDTGLESMLSEFFNAWNDVSTNPQSIPQREVLIERARSVVNTAKNMESRIISTLKHINEDIENTVKQINTIASHIAELNDKIVQIEAGLNQEKALDLRDERDRLLEELSKLVNISVYEDKNGSVTVTVGMRNLVSGENVNPIYTVKNRFGNREIYIDKLNITPNVLRGRLGGLLSVRDYIESHPLHDLRKLVASLIKEINLLHRQGYGLDSSTENDFFNQLELSTMDFSTGADITATILDHSSITLDEYYITFDSTDYYVYNRQTDTLITSGTYISGNPIVFDGIEVVITGTVTPSDEFIVSPLEDAIENFDVAISDPRKVASASSDTGLPGDNQNALQIVELFHSPLSNLGNITFTDYLREIVSNTGTVSKAASDNLKFDNTLLEDVKNRRESISGVSLDEEAINLIRFQRAFEAGARIIKVTDELLQTIIEL
ncbi:Flagellar hook-associated protein 1 [bacterium HR37]|nr:Flagellar hook-associated protein 1 [bacterium HR37]